MSMATRLYFSAVDVELQDGEDEESWITQWRS
jgi:hypothetical protein